MAETRVISRTEAPYYCTDCQKLVTSTKTYYEEKEGMMVKRRYLVIVCKVCNKELRRKDL